MNKNNSPKLPILSKRETLLHAIFTSIIVLTGEINLSVRKNQIKKPCGGVPHG